MNTTNKKPQYKLESVRVGLVSSKKIREWAERTLPNGKKVGQVMTSQTLNYKTLKPYPGGLFCERIFGPIKDFQCACGRRKTQVHQKICPDCEVEYISARIRRYRLGYIQLAAPVTHIWYLKSTPSYIGLLLDMSRKQVEAIAYCTESIKIPNVKWISDEFLVNSKKKEISLWDSTLLKDSLKGTKQPFFDENEKIKPKYKFQNSNIPQVPAQATWLAPSNQEASSYIEGVRVQGFSKAASQGTGATWTSPQEGEETESVNKKNLSFYPPLFLPSSRQSDENSKNLKIKNLADFYGIARNFSAEAETDWDAFISYMENTPLQSDFAIPIYKNFLHRKPSKESFPSPKIEKTGAEALYILLAQLDLVLVEKQLYQELFEFNEKLVNLNSQGSLPSRKRKQLKLLIVARWKKIRRLKVVRSFRRTLSRPEWMILTVLPVLPPDLRPALPMNGNLMISDLNSLYKLVLDRNRRVREAKEDTPETRKMRLRLLQEAVDSVIENGKGGANPISDKNNKRPLKSLADLLKGKQGRFRENLLGKRVDYSGRSVIVVGPSLKIHECGIPKAMAIALFQPFLIRYLLKKNIARTIVSAKLYIFNKEPIIWDLLDKILERYPVLLNRAPTLHRLNIQAFQAKLVEGKAILLHPLVCNAFNADFDGDQMGVHVPLSSKARAEAWSLLWSRNNLLSPATGQPLMLPSQDMVLGCYYATTTHSKILLVKNTAFTDLASILKVYQQGFLKVHCWVWVRWNFLIENSSNLEKPVELRIDIFGNCLQIYNTVQRRYDCYSEKNFQAIRTTPGRILMNQLFFSTLI